jgi:hypothetical protein
MVFNHPLVNFQHSRKIKKFLVNKLLDKMTTLHSVVLIYFYTGFTASHHYLRCPESEI